MKSALITSRKSAPQAVDSALSFYPVGSNDGVPAADALERLKAFHARHPQTRRAPRKGQKSAVELVQAGREDNAARGRR
jgi:hypothetical protein